MEMITQLTPVTPASLLTLFDVDNIIGATVQRRITAKYRRPSASTALWISLYSFGSFISTKLAYTIDFVPRQCYKLWTGLKKCSGMF